jgi:signal transduction histidine kinase
VDLVEPDGSVRRVAVAPEQIVSSVPCLPEPTTRVGEQDGCAVLGVPLAVAGRTLGALRLTRPRSSGFDTADLALAEDVAGRAALAIEIARAYRKTEEAIRARDECLSVASHELRTPLATLQATTEALLAGAHGGVPSASPLAAPLHSIARQVARLSRLANQILDTIALETTGIDLARTDVDLASVAADVVARVNSIPRPPGEVMLAAPCAVRGLWDRARLEQVVETLVSNALRFGGGKPIAIRVGRREDRALLTVEDHGLGIPSERLGSLFARFERAGAARSIGGLGLGLHLGRAIVGLHGGTMRVESVVGRGTTFFVELPLSPARP